MMKTLSTAALLTLAAASGALAHGAVVTPATMCNEAQMSQAALAVDGIRNPQDRANARAELTVAVRFLQENQPEACMQHLTAASSFVTPNE